MIDTADKLILMAQTMIDKGATVKLGKRAVHVVLADSHGISTIRMTMSLWREIRPVIKVRAQNMQDGLKP